MNLPWIDFAIIGFFVISILIGLYRGFVKEILSLTSWVLAALVAYRYGELVAGYIRPYIQQPLDLAIAYVAVFLLTLIALSILGHIIHQIFSSSGMSGIDRSLGGMFGILRAAVVIALLIMFARSVNLDQQPWLSDSTLMAYFEPIIHTIKSYLPEAWAAKLA